MGPEKLIFFTAEKTIWQWAGKQFFCREAEILDVSRRGSADEHDRQISADPTL